MELPVIEGKEDEKMTIDEKYRGGGGQKEEEEGEEEAATGFREKMVNREKHV